MFLRHKTSYLTSGAIAIIFLAGILFFGNNSKIPNAKAAATDNVRGFAWSSNIGWISFNSLNCDTNDNGFIDTDAMVLGCGGNDDVTTPSIDYGVNLDLGGTNNLSGYAWSENIGWISFEAADVAGCPSGTCQPRLVGADFYGWARALSNGGGWDGWISLNSENCDIAGGISNGFIDIACGGDNATTAVVNYNPILNGTDFEGWAWGSDVVGWVSFNCTNTGVCASSNYKVYLNISVYAENLQAFRPDYCNQSPSFSLRWIYRNPGGINQSQYNIQVATDAAFTSLVVDTTNPQIVAPNGIGTTALIIRPSPTASLLDLDIGYGSAYYWRVRVRDASGIWSGWVEYNDPAATVATDGDNDPKTFTTDLHMWPSADFTCPAPDPACAAIYPLLSSIQFTDNSACYDNSNNAIACSNWNWNFGDGTPNSSVQNPLHQYTAAGAPLLTFTVGDGLYSCFVSKIINIGTSASPKWKEVIPR